MKIKHELISHSVLGVVQSYYIRKIKEHWWNKWKTVMDGSHPQMYDKVNGQFIARF